MSKRINEDYLITIRGTMEQDGDVDDVQLMTRGSFVKRAGSYFIAYHETEATGYEGSLTTVKVQNNTKVSMTRVGASSSQLVIERGRRHVCHYDAGFGSLSLGVAADDIQNSLTDKGGQLTFSYTLDSGQEQISRNCVHITIQEAN